ncbi:MAG TPA: ATP-binding protein [Prolixibacteraceae bacterium]|jgi:signal transduction histidine kinase
MKTRIAIKITLIYFITGFLWILFSDQLIQGISGSAEVVTHLQTFKGGIFVALTAFLLFLLIDKEIKRKNVIEADLLKAKEKAEESDRLKSAFLSNMSHEIRTPLNGILGFCELILDESFTKEEKQIFAKHMAKNGNDFLKLINDIMDISKLQENQFAIAKKDFNVNQLLENIYEDYRQSELRIHRQRLDFQLIKGAEEVETELYSDSVRLTHILQNLLNNSFFFTNEGFVHFGYRKLNEGFEFFVEDSGSGIDSKSQELIFKPFFKGKDPIVGNRGFGLGLAISKGLVKLLGGELKFKSTPNIGSRFYFTLGIQQTPPPSMEKNGWKIEHLTSKVINFDSTDIQIRQN